MVVLLLLMLLVSPALAQESVLLNVNQTHTLQWNWQQGEQGPVRQFVFQCQQYRKDLEADARSLRFGTLIDQPGRYTGCMLSAKNEAGLSAPVVIPDFEYAYSYRTLGWLLLECLASASAAAGVLSVCATRLVRRLRRERQLALPEPVIVLNKERNHATRA